MKINRSHKMAIAWTAGAFTPSGARRTSGFSLVEVTLAIGIMGFAFVTIFALIPVGLRDFRDTKNVTVASEISQRIFSELQDTPFTKVGGGGLIDGTTAGNSWSMTYPDPANPPSSGSPGKTTAVRYFDDQGTETKSTDLAAVFFVNVAVSYAPNFVQAGANTTAIQNTALAKVTVQVAYNPGRQTLTPNATTALWPPPVNAGGSMRIFNYSTFIAKNS